MPSLNVFNTNQVIFGVEITFAKYMHAILNPKNWFILI